MKINEIMSILEAECLTGEHLLDDIKVEAAFGCDLMSDVLAFINGKTLLLTGLINPQVIRTAEMVDINVIVFVRGKKPDKEVIELAKKNNIILLSTNHILYTACGILYNNGLKGIPIRGGE
ncbi:hypothetical protein FQB35_07985 [Crassaminicella thermophila]|uniref:DRTGG domain-containing protein n=1 Tax=Crassaminicella thermophila TaxID=2599308 RepID=A0A5C0SEG1_CRATE|nr:DRTGG domain-containing protein [Crassaminicella thermophila]QEK12322.1 hypothetical protein FQB35_07985 [Crassaminicella thermophila]